MSHFEVGPQPGPSKSEAAREYLFDMIDQLARLARGSGETQAAIFLEAILAAHRMANEDAPTY